MSQQNDANNSGENQKNFHKPIEIRKTISAKPISNKFSLVLKTDPFLGDTIQQLNVDLCFKEITFVATETNDYKWIDWLLNLDHQESISLFFLDNQGKNRCMLLVDKISLISHDMFAVNPNPQNNYELNYRIRHKISLEYENIQKVYIDGSKPVKYKPVKKKNKRSN